MFRNWKRVHRKLEKQKKTQTSNCYHDSSVLKRRWIDTGVFGTAKCMDKPARSSWYVRIKHGSDCERWKRGKIHSNFDNVSSIF